MTKSVSRHTRIMTKILSFGASDLPEYPRGLEERNYSRFRNVLSRMLQKGNGDHFGDRSIADKVEIYLKLADGISESHTTPEQYVANLNKILFEQVFLEGIGAYDKIVIQVCMDKIESPVVINQWISKSALSPGLEKTMSCDAFKAYLNDNFTECRKMYEEVAHDTKDVAKDFHRKFLQRGSLFRGKGKECTSDYLELVISRLTQARDGGGWRDSSSKNKLINLYLTYLGLATFGTDDAPPAYKE